jgi:hypothetical protein
MKLVMMRTGWMVTLAQTGVEWRVVVTVLCERIWRKALTVLKRAMTVIKSIQMRVARSVFWLAAVTAFGVVT